MESGGEAGQLCGLSSGSTLRASRPFIPNVLLTKCDPMGTGIYMCIELDCCGCFDWVQFEQKGSPSDRSCVRRRALLGLSQVAKSHVREPAAAQATAREGLKTASDTLAKYPASKKK